MSGILERIEAKLDRILAMSTPLNNSVEDVIKLSPRDALLDEMQDEVVTEERDLLGKGVTWDARIHTSTKKQSMKNTWKRKPGVTEECFNAVMVELNEMVPFVGEKSEPTKKAPPSKPSKKAPPVKKAPPKSPVRQGDEHKFKPRAMKNIASLTTDFEASHEVILENLISKHGVDTLDALPESSHEDLFEDSHDWLNTLNNLQNEIDILTELSEKEDGTYKDTISETINEYITDAGANSNKLGSVPLANLESLKKELREYVTGWEDYFA